MAYRRRPLNFKREHRSKWGALQGDNRNMHAPILLKASVLAITFSLSAVPVWAQPAGVKGACLGNITITGTVLQQLASVNILTVPKTSGADAVWHCAITCSTQITNPVPTAARGLLALTTTEFPYSHHERDFEQTNDAAKSTPPTTTWTNKRSARRRIFRSLRRHPHPGVRCGKTPPGPHFDVRRSCITVVCTDESPAGCGKRLKA